MKINEWLDAISKGETVESVSMGGLGEGYEICIQHLAVEICQRLPKEINPDDFPKILEEVTEASAKALNPKHHFSGAQIGAASNLAANIFRRGTESFKSVPDRIIHIAVDGGDVKIISGDVGQNPLPS